MKIAVVTDAVSDQYFFPIWRQYYGHLFGPENLFVVTYLNADFRSEGLGGVIRLPTTYDDAVRPGTMGPLVTALLKTYDLVIRVDTDEILVVDPRVASNLKSYFLSSAAPYYTARGFDVVQTIGEPALVPGPILSQRRYAYPISALNKTAATRQPLTWSSGFHWASVPPVFSPLFLLHLKRVDIEWQCRWYAEMTRNIGDNPAIDPQIRAYYAANRAAITAYHAGVSGRPRLEGLDAWYREEHQQRFLESVKLIDGLYFGDYAHESALLGIPPEWATLF